MAPTAQMSARRSSRCPSACSGAMYWILPLRTPEFVSAPARERAFAIPKSMSFAMPLVLTRMLCGLTSRWTISSGRPDGSLQLVRLVQACARVGEDAQETPVGIFMPFRWQARLSFESASPSTYSIAR